MKPITMPKILEPIFYDPTEVKMEYRYIKKPVVVEAFQMTEQHRHNNFYWPQWLHDAWNKDPTEVGAVFPVPGSSEVQINTLEGLMRVNTNDFIIQGVKGELYPCKPDIFHATYQGYHDENDE